MKTEQLVKDLLDNNPEVRLILEIAARAKQAESVEPAINIGTATEIVALPTNSQHPVPPVTFGQIQRA